MLSRQDTVLDHTVTVYWYGGSNWLSKLIKTVAGCQFTHVAADFTDQQGESALYEANWGGVQRHTGAKRQRVLRRATAKAEVPVSQNGYERALMFLDSQVANKYSILGFLAAGLDALFDWNLIIRLDGRHICSGLVARALYFAGLWFDEDPALIDPCEMAETFTPETI